MPPIIGVPRPLHIGTNRLISPSVASPPSFRLFSISSARLPARRAASAAAMPATPPPATTTSYSPATRTRLVSSTYCIRLSSTINYSNRVSIRYAQYTSFSATGMKYSSLNDSTSPTVIFMSCAPGVRSAYVHLRLSARWYAGITTV